MNTKNRHHRAIAAAVGIWLALLMPHQAAWSANNDGALVGRITASDPKALEGVEVTVRNPQTGFARTTRPDADGNYRFPFLPVGSYVLEATRGGTEVGKLGDVNVGLGNTTTADVQIGGETLATVEVLSSRITSAVDVTSTESATNVSLAELARLPVERDITSVALLAPGLNKGDSAFGGISFGGSSVAENTVYINGLNVTDFYNRVGSSSVPFAFYKEFQVKTGGYSVEFGRTTGGVINAVTKSGTNEFDFGTEIAWEPSFLQTKATDHLNADGSAQVIAKYDEYDRTSANFYASGPIIVTSCSSSPCTRRGSTSRRTPPIRATSSSMRPPTMLSGA
ncbi:MAG: TonB-dependent receptor plug domain-containing protein [Gammaproteobacteria bacterium]|nr:TonB-dependent receptor plug domain-containing protein [Gammaproteobacteria bacterium]